MESSQSAVSAELNLKLERIRELLIQWDLDALLLQKVENFAWATCGWDSHINLADAMGIASILITRAHRFVMTNNIEASRLMQEEGLGEQGWEFKISPRYERNDQVSGMTHGMRLGADGRFSQALDLSAEIASLRAQLTVEEGVRYRELGYLCAQGMREAAEAVQPGMTEFEISGLLDQTVESKVVQVVVNLGGLPIERGGIKSTVGEYSISSVGPGPRALAHWQGAQQAGLRTGAVIQFNNTCEIASLPYLPVVDLVAEHCHKLVSAVKLDVMLIGWTMGGYPSPNFQLAGKMSLSPTPDMSAALDAVALERYGPEGVPHARKAWTFMSNAFREYTFHISVVYTSPVQVGPANPLYLEKSGYSA